MNSFWKIKTCIKPLFCTNCGIYRSVAMSPMDWPFLFLCQAMLCKEKVEMSILLVVNSVQSLITPDYLIVVTFFAWQSHFLGFGDFSPFCLMITLGFSITLNFLVTRGYFLKTDHTILISWTQTLICLVNRVIQYAQKCKASWEGTVCFGETWYSWSFWH